MTNFHFCHFFLFGRCVNTEAATVLTLAGVLGLLSNFDAIVATFFEVVSDLDFDIKIEFSE